MRKWLYLCLLLLVLSPMAKAQTRGMVSLDLRPAGDGWANHIKPCRDRHDRHFINLSPNAPGFLVGPSLQELKQRHVKRFVRDQTGMYGVMLDAGEYLCAPYPFLTSYHFYFLPSQVDNGDPAEVTGLVFSQLAEAQTSHYPDPNGRDFGYSVPLPIKGGQR